MSVESLAAALPCQFPSSGQQLISTQGRGRKEEEGKTENVCMQERWGWEEVMRYFAFVSMTEAKNGCQYFGLLSDEMGVTLKANPFVGLSHFVD